MSSACFKSITNACGTKLKANPKPRFCEEEGSLFTPRLPPKLPTHHRLIFQDTALLPVSCVSPRVTQHTHTVTHLHSTQAQVCTRGWSGCSNCDVRVSPKGLREGLVREEPSQPGAWSRRAPQSQAWLHKVHSPTQKKKGKSSQEERLSFQPAMRPQLRALPGHGPCSPRCWACPSLVLQKPQDASGPSEFVLNLGKELPARPTSPSATQGQPGGCPARHAGPLPAAGPEQWLGGPPAGVAGAGRWGRPRARVMESRGPRGLWGYIPEAFLNAPGSGCRVPTVTAPPPPGGLLL